MFAVKSSSIRQYEQGKGAPRLQGASIRSVQYGRLRRRQDRAGLWSNRFFAVVRATRGKTWIADAQIPLVGRMSGKTMEAGIGGVS